MLEEEIAAIDEVREELESQLRTRSAFYTLEVQELHKFYTLPLVRS